MNRLWPACAWLLAALPAHALVGGSFDPNTASSPWAGVGAVVIGGGTFSGALIDDLHVLTAAHVVGAQVGTPGNVSFVLNAGSDLSHQVSAAAIAVHPSYTGTTPGADNVWHDDLAVITLGTPITGVPTYALYSGGLADQIVTLVGYGRGGDGVNGATVAASPSIKRTGRNRIDVLCDDDDGGGFKEVFAFDFDGPTALTNVFGPAIQANLTLGAGVEAQFASGDSGSPVLVSDGGVWKLAGVANFNGSVTGLPGSNVLFGAVGGGTIVAPYAAWITAVTAVPEPATWAMLLAGLGLLRVRARSRAGR